MIRARGIVYNSVIDKELRTRMRGWRSIAVLMGYMAVLGIIAIAVLVQQVGPSAAGQSSQAGLQLYEVLCIFQLLLILFVTPATTASAISGERQRQTWDLLRVTHLSSFGIVWGKLVAGLAFNLLLIFGSLPLFSLVFLFGGVAPDDILHTYVVFLATVLLLGMSSLFISALTRRVAASMVISNIVALAISVGIGLFTIYLEQPTRPQFGPNGPIVPPLTPLAQIDPLIALLSALPNTTGGTVLDGIGQIHHAFGLHVTMPLWGAFCLLAILISAVLFLLTAALVRSSPRWLRTEGT
ncbi:MAG TPA: ABC transporter permease subunit [Chloroflexota bacterium]|nr:ABC transporter permease subunit [Chloroflexota bacterium]